MLIRTRRFGPLEVEEDKVITFEQGLLGFPNQQRYTLLHTTPDPVFYWLQSLDDPDLAFVVCDPRTFVLDYEVAVRTEEVAGLQLAAPGDAQVLVIVNKVDGELTGNLFGPVILNPHNRRARQLVLTDKRYGTRHTLAPSSSRRRLAKTA